VVLLVLLVLLLLRLLLLVLRLVLLVLRLVLFFRSGGSQEWILIFRHGLVRFGSVRFVFTGYARHHFNLIFASIIYARLHPLLWERMAMPASSANTATSGSLL
jgi:hypothetical protein